MLISRGPSLVNLASAGRAPVSLLWPLSISSSGRYLQKNDGSKFPLLVRALWFIPSLTKSAYEALIDNTVTHGFTAIEFYKPHTSGGNQAPYANSGAYLPFTKRLDGNNWTGALTYTNAANEAPDFTQPNESYWAHLDSIIDYAAGKGLAVLFFPAYHGYGTDPDQGWQVEIVANGTTKLTTYGAWLATRWASKTNLIWMLGGDAGTGTGGTLFTTAQTNAHKAVIDGIQTVGAHATTLVSQEWNSNSIGTDNADFDDYITVNGSYSWTGSSGTYARNGYSYATRTIPTFQQEGPFDEEGPDGSNDNPNATQPVRRFAWWAWINSIAGYSFGNGYVWRMNAGYTDHINTTQTQHHAVLNTFIKSKDWASLVPDGLAGIGTLVTANKGTVDTSNYVAAAAASDGSLLVAYLSPSASAPTIDMTKMRGTTTARWFDPTNGSYSSIGSYANTGTRTYTPTGNNSAGAGDWVLVLEA